MIPLLRQPTYQLSSHPLNLGLVSCWKVMPAFGSGIAFDLNGRNNLTFPGGTADPAWKGSTRPGAFGEWNFDGTNDYISGSNGPSGTGPISITAWINTTRNAANNNTFIYWGSTTTGQLMQIGIEINGVLWGRFSGNTANGGTNLNDGLWHHVVVVKPESATPSEILMYADGASLSVTPSGSTTLSPGTTYPVNLGRSVHVSWWWLGSLDEVRIYNRVLSAAEVSQLYLLTQQRFGPLFYQRPMALDVVAAGGVWPHHLDNYSMSGGYSDLGI